MEKECKSCRHKEKEGFEYPCKQCSHAYSDEWEPMEKEDNQDE